MTGVLYGVGVGPGDPDLLTLKALRRLQSVPVIAYPAPLEGDSLARAVAAPHLGRGSIELPLRLPLQPEADPAPHYDRHAEALADHLTAGRDVAVLCLGDPLFYGSFQYLMARLAGRFPMRVIPGVTSVAAASATTHLALASYDDTFVVAPATLDTETLGRHLSRADSAAVMKVGRHLGRVRNLLRDLGRLDGAVYAEHLGMDRERLLALAEVVGDEAPYFSMILVTRREVS